MSDELQTWIEPELEARMVAMLLGEASDFEVEELERLMEERPELVVFRRRLEAVQGLLSEPGVVKALVEGNEENENETEWQLSSERRAAILKLTEEAEPADGERVPGGEKAGGVKATDVSASWINLQQEKESKGGRGVPANWSKLEQGGVVKKASSTGTR